MPAASYTQWDNGIFRAVAKLIFIAPNYFTYDIHVKKQFDIKIRSPLSSVNQ